MRTNTLNLLDIFVQDENTETLKRKILECDDATKLLEYTTLILNVLNRSIKMKTM